MIQRVSGITKKNRTWPNFSGFSAIMPIPAAPIPCCSLPVPIYPPAIAIAAANDNIGFVRSAPPAASSAPNTFPGDINANNKTAPPKTPRVTLDVFDNANMLL